MEQERMRAEEEEEAHQEKDPFRNYIQLHLQRLESSGEGVTAQERLDKPGESFISSPRKGNEKYRRGQRMETNRTADLSHFFFFFCTELPYSTPQG